MTKFDKYTLNAVADVTDVRDRYYEPRLQPLADELLPPAGLEVLDQGQEGACTGFGLAAVINRLYQARGDERRVSARMLYEMAKRYDEWPGEEYSGSSCRGAIRGWHNMGVCQAKLWPYEVSSASYLTRARALDARSQTLGAYYRLRHELVDFHSALNELGAIYVSADVHAGWQNPQGDEIPMKKERLGGHAFAIVGYNQRGFWVQNSWGPRWGKDGVALWRYEDWAANISDGWVFQLALPTPQLWESRATQRDRGSLVQEGARKVLRHEIAGHFVHLDDGRYDDKGLYFSNPEDVEEIVRCLKGSSSYDHVVLYAHGGLNSPKDSARRIRAMKPVWKDNRVYPIHFMYDTGLLEEAKDILGGKGKRISDRAGGVSDWFDRLFERATGPLGRALWRQMKAGAALPFDEGGDGGHFLKKLCAMLKEREDLKLHLVGHSNGSNLLAHLIQRLVKKHQGITAATTTLMAPAATVELFDSHIRPALGNGRLGDMKIYNLTDEAELDDTVGPYQKSLLYLVSRAFEDGDRPVPLVGMQKYSSEIDLKDLSAQILYTDGPHSNSTTHGGFDNDIATMNHVLRRVTGKRKPRRPFTKEDLSY